MHNLKMKYTVEAHYSIGKDAYEKLMSLEPDEQEEVLLEYFSNNSNQTPEGDWNNTQISIEPVTFHGPSHPGYTLDGREITRIMEDLYE